MKATGEFVKHRYLGIGDPPCEPGDILRFKSGRKYGVIDVRGKQLDCVVLSNDAKPVEGRMISWRWMPRKKRR